MSRWIVRRSRPAKRDFLNAIAISTETFGLKQARRYRATLLAALKRLEAGPFAPTARKRDDLGAGIFVLHAGGKGRNARHVILYRVIDEGILEVLRILHDAMDLARHLPSAENDD